VELRFEGSTVHVALDGMSVTKLVGTKAWRKGWSTALADGNVLSVRAIRPVLLPELAVLVNDKHVDGSPSHPRRMLRASAEGLLIGAAIFIALALAAKREVDRFSVAYEALQIAGAIFLLRRMYTGLLLVGLALLADLLTLGIVLLAAPGHHLIWPVLGRLLFVAFFVRSFIALRDLRNHYS
jgi:hypothetical protein